MPAGFTTAFGCSDEFQAALPEAAGAELLPTGQGRFRAHLTCLPLPQGYLLSGEERVARIAFVSSRPESVLVALPPEPGQQQTWGGVDTGPGELITVGPGQRIHWRTYGHCHWQLITLSIADLVRFGRALIGPRFAPLDGIRRWQPGSAALRPLAKLCHAATRLSRTQSGAFAAPSAPHGLSQELIRLLVDCLSAQPPEQDGPTRQRHIAIVSTFEDMIRRYPDGLPSVAHVSRQIGVSERTLQVCCWTQLGMSPANYARLHRLQKVHRELRLADPASGHVVDLARRHGFRDLGRFAAVYRDAFGELPSMTLRRPVGSNKAATQPG